MLTGTIISATLMASNFICRNGRMRAVGATMASAGVGRYRVDGRRGPRRGRCYGADAITARGAGMRERLRVWRAKQFVELLAARSTTVWVTGR